MLGQIKMALIAIAILPVGKRIVLMDFPDQIFVDVTTTIHPTVHNDNRCGIYGNFFNVQTVVSIQMCHYSIAAKCISSISEYKLVWRSNVAYVLLPRLGGAFDLRLAVSVPLPIVMGIFVLLWFQSRLT